MSRRDLKKGQIKQQVEFDLFFFFLILLFLKLQIMAPVK